jgi:hypothetical protein
VTVERNNYHLIELNPAPASAEVWHLWAVIVPRRSITGCLVELSGDVEMGASGSTRNLLSMSRNALNDRRPRSTWSMRKVPAGPD